MLSPFLVASSSRNSLQGLYSSQMEPLLIFLKAMAVSVAELQNPAIIVSSVGEHFEWLGKILPLLDIFITILYNILDQS